MAALEIVIAIPEVQAKIQTGVGLEIVVCKALSVIYPIPEVIKLIVLAVAAKAFHVLSIVAPCILTIQNAGAGLRVTNGVEVCFTWDFHAYVRRTDRAGPAPHPVKIISLEELHVVAGRHCDSRGK